MGRDHGGNRCPVHALLMQIGDGTRQLSDNVGTEMTERDVTTTY